MAATTIVAAFSVAFALFISGVLGETNCEELDRSTCAFAVSSSGFRCVLEKHAGGAGRKEENSCRNSCVKAAGLAGWVESDKCVAACGLRRETYGISSDSLLDRQFLRQLCSSACYKNCPNIIDLYTNVAAGEGVYLTELCGVKEGRREMVEMNSHGSVAKRTSGSPAPMGGMMEAVSTAEAPTAGGRRLVESAAEAPTEADGRRLVETTADAPKAGKRVLEEFAAETLTEEDGRSLVELAEEAWAEFERMLVESTAEAPTAGERMLVEEGGRMLADSIPEVPTEADGRMLVESSADAPMELDGNMLVEATADAPMEDGKMMVESTAEAPMKDGMVMFEWTAEEPTEDGRRLAEFAAEAQATLKRLLVESTSEATTADGRKLAKAIARARAAMGRKLIGFEHGRILARQLAGEEDAAPPA